MKARLLALSVSLSPMLAVACSGKGVGREMEAARVSGNVGFGIVAVLAAGSLICAFRLRRWWWPAMCFGILAIHPALWISPYQGDCGYTLQSGAHFFTYVAIGMVGAQLFLGMRKPTKRKLDFPFVPKPSAADYEGLQPPSAD